MSGTEYFKSELQMNSSLDYQPQKVIDLYRNYRMECLQQIIDKIKARNWTDVAFDLDVDVIIKDYPNFEHNFISMMNKLFDLIYQIISNTQFRIISKFYSLHLKKFYLINEDTYTSPLHDYIKTIIDKKVFYEKQCPVNILILKDRIEKLIRGLKSKFLFDFEIFANRSFYYITIFDYFGKKVFSFGGFQNKFHLIKSAFEFLSSDYFIYAYYYKQDEALINSLLNSFIYKYYLVNCKLGYDYLLTFADIKEHINWYNKTFIEKIVLTNELKEEYNLY